MEPRNEDRVARFEQALLALDFDGAKEILKDEAGKPLGYSETEAVIVPALESIGQGWEEGRIALSQVYMSGRHCESLMGELQPEASEGRAAGARLAGVVLEDYHFLGMRLVSSVLRASGFTILSYGRMTVDEIVERVAADKIDILLASVLMMRSALRVRELRRKLDEAGSRVKLAVGGAPFRLDKELWREVGADGTADTAAGAVELIKQLSGELKNE